MGYKGIGLPFAGTVYGDLRYNKVKILKHRIWCVDELPEFKEFLIDCLYKMSLQHQGESREN